MKITKVYKNQVWACFECGFNINPSDVILSPFPLNILNKFKKSDKCDFINKRGFLMRTSMDYIKNSNFNRMMICPKCKKIAFNGFKKHFPPNSKRKNLPQYEKRLNFLEEEYLPSMYTTTTIIENNN